MSTRTAASSIIDSWLENHPGTPDDYEAPLQLKKCDTQKRRPANRSNNLTKRRRLAEIQANSVSMAPKQREKQQLLSTPEKTKKNKKAKDNNQGSLPIRTRSTMAEDRGVFDDDNDDGEDNEATPKSTRQPRLLRNVPTMRRPTSQRDRPQHGGSSSNADSASTDRSRSKSPRKARPEMRLADTAVVFIDIDLKDPEFPTDALDLCKDIMGYQRQQGLLPLSIRERAQEEFPHDFYYSQHPDAAKVSNREDEVRMWKDVLDVCHAARKCYILDTPESTWNMEVNAPVLRMALRDHWNSYGVCHKDLTTARVSDKDFLPKASGAAMKAKMVDFGIVIEPPTRSLLWKMIADKCKALPYGSINQTDAPHLLQSPIVISTEVKRAGGDADEALVQLGTWVTAHYNHLRVLLESTDAHITLPILPLLQVQGDEWRLIIAEPNPGRNEIMLHSYIRLGSTRDVLGTYQVVASLRRLARWVSEAYRPWWTKAALGYEEGKTDSEGEDD
ncbi:MAG: hypothetical protein Q9225_005269 [Loekoesia sp. 1 TL-2023]